MTTPPAYSNPGAIATLAGTRVSHPLATDSGRRRPAFFANNAGHCANPRAISGTSTAFERHVSAPGPCFRAILGAILFLRCDYRHNVLGALLCLTLLRFQNTFSPHSCSKTEKPARAHAAILPAIVGRNTRLRACSPDTILGRARSLGTPRRGIAGSAINDLTGSRRWRTRRAGKRTPSRPSAASAPRQRYSATGAMSSIFRGFPAMRPPRAAQRQAVGLMWSAVVLCDDLHAGGKALLPHAQARLPGRMNQGVGLP